MILPENNVGNMDCISRAQTQTEIEMNASRYTIARERGGMGQVEWSDQLIKVRDAVDIIKNLPPVTPQDIDYKAQYERLSQKAEIVISQLRADRDRLMSLTSVTPIRPKGHWIGKYQVDFGEWQEYDVKLSDGFVTDNCHCSECGEELLSGDRGMFCPYCGSDNREVEE